MMPSPPLAYGLNLTYDRPFQGANMSDQPKPDFTRRQQTVWIISALAAIGVILAVVLWPAPDFTAMSAMERCAHSSWSKSHGGSKSACERQVVDAARARLMSM